MPVIPPARPRWWPGGPGWALWALFLLAVPAVAWLDHLLRQAGRPELTLVAPQQRPPGGSGGDRGHGRGSGGQPPAPPPGGLATARPGAVADHVGSDLRVHPLRASGPARGAASGQLPGRAPRRPRHHLALMRQLRPVAHPDWEATLAALALVGRDCRGRGQDVAAGLGRSPGTAVSGVPDHREPARRPIPASWAAGHRPAGRRRCRPGFAGRRGRVAGGTLPRPRDRAPAAALAGGERPWPRWRCWPPWLPWGSRTTST